MNKAQKRHEVQSDFNETGAPPGAHSASLQTSKDRTHTHTHTAGQPRPLTCCTLTFRLKLLHHIRHHVLVVGLSSLDDLDVQAVVHPLKL